MKTILKLSASLLLLAAINTAFAQQSAGSQPKAPQDKKSSKHHVKSPGKGIDNKIAVSDQARPNDKKKSAKPVGKKGEGISNK